jgi:hypothetical protein
MAKPVKRLMPRRMVAGPLREVLPCSLRWRQLLLMLRVVLLALL